MNDTTLTVPHVRANWHEIWTFAFTYNAYAGLVAAAEELQAGSTAYFKQIGPAREVFARALG